MFVSFTLDNRTVTQVGGFQTLITGDNEFEL